MRWPCILGFWRAPLPAGILALPAWLSWRLRWDKKNGRSNAFFLRGKRGIGRGTLRFPFTKVSLRAPKKDQDLPLDPRDFLTKHCFGSTRITPVTVITNWWHYILKKNFIQKPGILGTPKMSGLKPWTGGSPLEGTTTWHILRKGGFRFQPYISYTRLQGLAKNKSKDFRQMWKMGQIPLNMCENGRGE